MGCGGSKPEAVEKPGAAAGPKGSEDKNKSAPAPPVEDSASGKAFEDVYTLGKELGAGAFSVVKEGSHKQTGDKYAIKIVTKDKLTEEDEIALKDEIEVLTELRHKHIIRLYDVFDDDKYYYLVTEEMLGGELFDRIVQKSYYNEKDARDVCQILYDALNYCHEKKIAHRDLKPENLLLQSQEDDANIKIADFGFAKRCLGPKSLKTQCGTPGYVAPEILEGKPYDTKADMWSIGVIVYTILGGYPPFIEQDQKTLFKKIRKGKYEFHEEYWGQVSKDAKAMITSLLTVNMDKRASAGDVLKHKWIMADASSLTNDLGANLEKFKAFNGKRKFKAAVATVVAANKINSLGINFRENIVPLDD